MKCRNYNSKDFLEKSLNNKNGINPLQEIYDHLKYLIEPSEAKRDITEVLDWYLQDYKSRLISSINDSLSVIEYKNNESLVKLSEVIQLIEEEWIWEDYLNVYH